MRKCRHCKSRIPAIKDSNRHQVAGYCDDNCSFEHHKANQAKIRERGLRAREKADKKQKREFRDNHFPKQFDLTKKAAQRLANRLDAHLPCICCDAPRGSAQFCGGHFRTAGGHKHMALDIRNIHGQRNKHCNQALSGNIDGNGKSKGFRQGIIDRYGQALLDYLEGPHETKNYSCDELRAMRAEINAEIRRLEQGLPPSRDWRSLDQ